MSDYFQVVTNFVKLKKIIYNLIRPYQPGGMSWCTDTREVLMILLG